MALPGVGSILGVVRRVDRPAAGFAINTHLVTIASRLGAVEEAIRRDEPKRLT